MHNIKKCPFCGGNGELKQRYNPRQDNFMVFVACSVCNAESKVFLSQNDVSKRDYESNICDKAVEAWNMEYKGER